MNWYWNLLGIENDRWRLLWILLNIKVIVLISIWSFKSMDVIEYIIYTNQWDSIFRVINKYFLIGSLSICGLNGLMIIVNWVIKGFKKG